MSHEPTTEIIDLVSSDDDVETSRVVAGNLASSPPSPRSLAPIDDTVNIVGGGAVPDCDGHRRPESTHLDMHLPEEETANFTEDEDDRADESLMTDDLTVYHSAPEEEEEKEATVEEQSDDLRLRLSTITSDDEAATPEKKKTTKEALPTPFKASVFFSIGKRKSLGVARNASVLASGSDDDEEEKRDTFCTAVSRKSIGARKKVDKKNRRRSTLGRHEVILLPSDSDEADGWGDDEDIRIRPTPTSPVVKKQNVQAWVAKSPFSSPKQSPKTLRELTPTKDAVEELGELLDHSALSTSGMATSNETGATSSLPDPDTSIPYTSTTHMDGSEATSNGQRDVSETSVSAGEGRAHVALQVSFPEEDSDSQSSKEEEMGASHSASESDSETTRTVSSYHTAVESIRNSGRETTRTEYSYHTTVESVRRSSRKPAKEDLNDKFSQLRLERERRLAKEHDKKYDEDKENIGGQSRERKIKFLLSPAASNSPADIHVLKPRALSFSPNDTPELDAGNVSFPEKERETQNRNDFFDDEVEEGTDESVAEEEGSDESESDKHVVNEDDGDADDSIQKLKKTLTELRKKKVRAALLDKDSDESEDDGENKYDNDGSFIDDGTEGEEESSSDDDYSEEEEDDRDDGDDDEQDDESDSDDVADPYEIPELASPPPSMPPPRPPQTLPPKIRQPKTKALQPPGQLSIYATPGGGGRLLNRPLSFLKSLDLVQPNDRCHVDAVKYITHFEKHRDELARRLFNLFNEEVFALGIQTDTELVWKPRLTKTAGLCHCKRRKRRDAGGKETEERYCFISLSSKVLDSADRLRDTLIHEMCHAATWIISGYSDGHGPLWRDWGRRAVHEFPELPFIARCHSYKIRTKFTYRCKRCGYHFGRHSKSLDTARNVCGKCRGEFELIVNYKSGAASATPGRRMEPRTPKAPNAFALFVKDNYKLYRTPGSKHADVMKTLSSKFSAAKIKD